MTNRTYNPRGKTIDGYAVREHPVYGAWANMLSRCFDKSNVAYSNYGSRGVIVCPRWYHFANFAADMGMRPNPKLTLERVDNDGIYCPENCIWDSRSNQCVNRRRFSNNTSGITGVIVKNGRFEARFDYDHVRYRLGSYSDIDTAANVRSAFKSLFFIDRPSAQLMVDVKTVWCTSTTGVRGITPHKDGGFVARASVNGKREYIGYFKTLQEADDARNRYLAT